MDEKEALTRVKTGNFNGGHGFDMQLLVDAVGVIGEMFKSGQISEVVRCKDCEYGHRLTDANGYNYRTCNYSFGHGMMVEEYGFCKYGVRRE